MRQVSSYPPAATSIKTMGISNGREAAKIRFASIPDRRFGCVVAVMVKNIQDLEPLVPVPDINFIFFSDLFVDLP